MDRGSDDGGSLPDPPKAHLRKPSRNDALASRLLPHAPLQRGGEVGEGRRLGEDFADADLPQFLHRGGFDETGEQQDRQPGALGLAGVGTGIPILPGKYFVGIAPSNFTSPGVLAGYHSSATVATLAGAPFETPVLANQTTDNDRDNYDDGLRQSTGFYASGVLSGVLNLVPVAEPQNETTAGTPGATGGNTPGFFNTIDGTASGAPIFDFNSNVTVDFGFYTQCLGDVVFADDGGDGSDGGFTSNNPNTKPQSSSSSSQAVVSSPASSKSSSPSSNPPSATRSFSTTSRSTT